MGPVFMDLDGDGKVDLWISDSKYDACTEPRGSQFET